MADPEFGVVIRHGAYLPHWTRDGAIYAVTFHLADSLPIERIISWKRERDDLIKVANLQRRPLSAHEQNRLRQLREEKIELFLDHGHGECLLQDPRIAQMLCSSFSYFDSARYLLNCYCVMPNHAHVVFRPLGTYSLSAILHSWRSFTAHEANLILNRDGQFWHTESYDHLIRDEEDFINQVEYAWSNPDRASLSDWSWRYRRPLEP